MSDLIRSVEARITTHQHERQALVAQVQDIRRTVERLLVVLVGRAEAPRAADEGCARWREALGLCRHAHEDGRRGEKAVGRIAEQGRVASLA